MTLPRVLIIGQSFNTNSGGGITQANLFGNWEKDKIAVVCTSHMLNNLNLEICDTYYQLGKEEYKWVFPFNYIQRNVSSGLIIFNENNNSKISTISRAKLRTRIANDYFFPFLEYIGVFHCVSKTILSDKLCKWIDKFCPDIIYAQASSMESVQFCQKMYNYINKPMIFHMMDDWPSTISEKGPFKMYWRRRIDREFRILLDKADMLLSISDAMAQEYKTRYGKHFITFHNPIDIGFWKNYQRKNYKLSKNPSVLYAGRIGVGIQKTLESMAKAIDQVNRDIKSSIHFVVQTEVKPVWIEKYSCANYKPLVPYNDLPRVFAEADLLFLPYDFSKESIKFIKYSMPTKASEYMMSGTPIIIFAPEVTAVVKYAQKGNWAKVVTENNIDTLADVIKNLVQSENDREEIAQNAIRIAETNHNSFTVRNHFREVIASMIK
jgi:glycosyltransferase involved in cell wall biosynthesis